EPRHGSWRDAGTPAASRPGRRPRPRPGREGPSPRPPGPVCARWDQRAGRHGWAASSCGRVDCTIEARGAQTPVAALGRHPPRGTTVACQPLVTVAKSLPTGSRILRSPWSTWTKPCGRDVTNGNGAVASEVAMSDRTREGKRLSVATDPRGRHDGAAVSRIFSVVGVIGPAHAGGALWQRKPRHDR